jgi:DNA-binding CsgD family transcriptional regulator
MLDLLDTPNALAPERLASLSARSVIAPYPVGAMAHRHRGYGGPERRGASSLQYRRMAQMLDTLDYGMLLIGETMAVSHINKAARRDLDENHPLQLVGGQLQARFGADVQPLREALVGATRRGLRRLLQLGDARHRVSVAVVPLPALGADDQPGAALLLGKRQVCEELTVEWFARSHGLTTAETTVIKGLCADLTPQQIAERHGVGLATIRTQIGSIRLKTGAGSIRALVQQVALLPPLVSALQTLPH